MKKTESLYVNKALRNDDVFIQTEIKSFEELTNGFAPGRKGLEQAIIAEGKIVNAVSNTYGHLTNQKFFGEVEAKLIMADVNYKTRSINRDNRSFAVDYILDDERYAINVKGTANANDKIVPMLRFVNSYDGSNKTSGHFGFYREVCQNGLHVANSKIGFSAKHSGNIVDVVLPEISILIEKFFANEFYELSLKFERMGTKTIVDTKGFVKQVAEKLNIMKYEASDKNPEPSANARLVMDIMEHESALLGTKPNLWIGYNAFNQLLHEKLKKTFELQKSNDGKLFNTILEMA